VVVERTGLPGRFVIQLLWKWERPKSDTTQEPENLELSDSPFVALEEKAGLKLEATRGPVEVLVIDSVERPSEN